MMHRLFFSGVVRLQAEKLRHYIAVNLIKDVPFKNPTVQEEFGVTAKQKGYTSPYWVKHQYIAKFKEAGYEIEIKPDEVPVQVVRKMRTDTRHQDDESDAKESIIDYYNIEQTTNPSIFDENWVRLSRFIFSKRNIPTDLHGQQFDRFVRLSMRIHLVKHLIRSSNIHWISEDQLKYFPQARPREGAQLLRVKDLPHGFYHVSEFQNKDTGNPIARWLKRKKSTAYSAVTGKPYAQHCQAKLQKVARLRGYKYRHWVTASQLAKFVPPLKLKPKQKGVSLKMTDAKTGKKTEVIAYNQKQLVQPRIVTVHINRIIGKTKFKAGKNTVVVANVEEATDDEIKDALISYGHIYQILRIRKSLVMVNFISDASAKEAIEKAQGMSIGSAHGIRLSAPQKTDEKVCKSMLMTGTCKIKERCPFIHDEEVINEIRKRQEERRNETKFSGRGGRRMEGGDSDGYSGASQFRDDSRRGGWGGRSAETSSWNKGSGWGRGGASESGGGWGESAQSSGRGGWGQAPPSRGRGGWGQSAPSPGRGGWGQAAPSAGQGGWGQSAPSAGRGGWGQSAPSAGRGGWGQSAPSAGRGGWGQAPSGSSRGGWGQAPPSRGRGGWG
ncbi:hypothetical protein XU18_3677 [Perkinsela sp. CCAP 1560/4]|nr:hypothetical protein XU18_3677 [Perkinsela sp. CCAP 1560/4]|eukprot:KNH05273.1 hypothetical protein XU18_3677 [Perkinsela sp. CCAP 1560/4]